ncbi:MAG: arylamine N-acetyltransferase [Acidimicrobiales bacterium]
MPLQTKSAILESMDVDAYLERIAFPGVPTTDLASLAALQRAHLGNVAFENLHVYYGREIRVDTDWSVPKVLSGRGGWCFELNGAFSELLGAIGFSLDRVPATVLLGEDPPEVPDHLAMIVHLDQSYLVDVGFGASFTRPLSVLGGHDAVEDHGEYRIERSGSGHHVLRFRGETEDEWSDQYRFGTTPVPLESFVERSRYLATEPGLQWTESPFATRLIPGGRVTLLKDRLKIRRDGKESVMPVGSDQWEEVLLEWFGMAP